MAQPPQYTRTKDFTEQNGSNTDHEALNAELDRAGISINAIRANLAILQADDGRLRPNVVTYDSLGQDLIDGISSVVTNNVQGSMDAAISTINEVVSDAESSIEQSVQRSENAAAQSIASAGESLSSAQSSEESSIASSASATLSAGSANASVLSAERSADSAEEAFAWANYPEGEVVPSSAHPDKFSAYHYAQKAEQHLEAATTAHRGTYYNAFDTDSVFYEVDTVAIKNAGSGYAVGNVAVILLSGAEYPAWVAVRSVNSSGAVTSIELSSPGIFSSQPADDVYQTSSDGGSGLTVSITTTEGQPSALRSIDNPRPNQTATVLHNERMGGTAWTFIYADRNGDGVYNWIEMIQISSLSGNIPDDEQTITSVSGVRSLTVGVKNDIAAAVSAMFEPGTRMLFQQSTAPAGWTRVIDPALDDSALRLATSSEVTGGGVNGFISQMASAIPVSGSIGATTLSVAQMPSHTHSTTTMSGAPSGGYWTGGSRGGAVAATSGYTGGSGSHTHSLSINALNLNVKYVDLIVCRKN